MQILLIAYGVFLIGSILFGGAAVYHARQFGLPGDRTRLATVLYLMTMVIIVVASLILISTTSFTGTEAV